MKKLSDFKDDDSIMLIGNLIEPVAEILANEEIQKIIANPKAKKYNLVKKIFILYPKEVREILTLFLDEEEKKQENNSIVDINRFSELIKDKGLEDFFSSQVQLTE